MKPLSKNPKIDKFITSMTGINRVASIIKEICPFCNERVDPYNFKDALSLKEFTISGLCQKCQDEMFGS